MAEGKREKDVPWLPYEAQTAADREEYVYFYELLEEDHAQMGKVALDLRYLLGLDGDQEAPSLVRPNRDRQGETFKARAGCSYPLKEEGLLYQDNNYLMGVLLQRIAAHVAERAAKQFASRVAAMPEPLRLIAGNVLLQGVEEEYIVRTFNLPLPLVRAIVDMAVADLASGIDFDVRNRSTG